MPGVWLLWAFIVAALAVRIAAAILLPNIVHSDETFQYLEQGHRLVYGVGIVPWEYLAGIRSWLFPGLLAAVIEVARLFGDTPETSSTTVAVFMSIVSLSSVVCGYLWGWRVGGLATAVTCGVLNAFWFELVYFAPHTLSENMGASALVAGLYLIYPGSPATSPKRLALGGVLLGLALIFRFQLGPAIFVAVVAVCRMDFRSRYLPLLLGAAVPVLLAGCLDAVTWSWPWQSIILNFWINSIQGVAAQFGSYSAYVYLFMLVLYWSWAFAFIIVLMSYGSRFLPTLIFVVITTFLVHTISGHKEYRYYSPVLPLIMTLVGVGSVQLAEHIGAAFPSRDLKLPILCGVPIAWIVVSLTLAVSKGYYHLWFRDAGSLTAMRMINADPMACGVGIFPSNQWPLIGGYAHLRTGLVLYGRKDNAGEEDASAYNYLIGYSERDFSALGFSKLRCWREPPGLESEDQPTCLWKRMGVCSPSVNAVLTATMPSFLNRFLPVPANDGQTH